VFTTESWHWLRMTHGSRFEWQQYKIPRDSLQAFLLLSTTSVILPVTYARFELGSYSRTVCVTPSQGVIVESFIRNPLTPYRDHPYQLPLADCSLVWLWVYRGWLGMTSLQGQYDSPSMPDELRGTKKGKGYKKWWKQWKVIPPVLFWIWSANKKIQCCSISTVLTTDWIESFNTRDIILIETSWSIISSSGFS
jgi:hypothetical protein